MTRILSKKGLGACPCRHTLTEILDRGYCPVVELRENYLNYEFKHTQNAIIDLMCAMLKNFKECLIDEYNCTDKEAKQIIDELEEMKEHEFGDGYGESEPDEDEVELDGEHGNV